MKKTIRLTESDLTRLVKRILSEVAEEPILNSEKQIFGLVGFDEGKIKPNTYYGKPIVQANIDNAVNRIVQFLTKQTGTLETLRKFRNSPDFRIPPFIEIHIGTSHSGSGETNASIAQGRYNFMTGVVMAAFKKMGVDASVAKAVVVNKTDNTYAPSNLDRNFYDPKLVKTKPSERMAWIVIKAVDTRGNTTKGIQDIQKGLNQASSVINTIFVDGVDETKILQYLTKLGTFSDVEDLNNAIIAGGKFDSLEGFLNDQLFDDPKQMRAASVILQKLAMDSGKQKNTVRIVGGKISIGIGE
jgi:hypothetical protein